MAISPNFFSVFSQGLYESYQCNNHKIVPHYNSFKFFKILLQENKLPELQKGFYPIIRIVVFLVTNP